MFVVVDSEVFVRFKATFKDGATKVIKDVTNMAIKPSYVEVYSDSKGVAYFPIDPVNVEEFDVSLNTKVVGNRDPYTLEAFLENLPKAQTIFYLDYRVPDKLYGQSPYTEGSQLIAHAAEGSPLYDVLHKAYLYGCLWGRGASKECPHSRVRLNNMLADNHNLGQVAYWLETDNHDGCLFYVEEVGWYMLHYGDGHYWLRHIESVNLIKYNAEFSHQGYRKLQGVLMAKPVW